MIARAEGYHPARQRFDVTTVGRSSYRLVLTLEKVAPAEVSRSLIWVTPHFTGCLNSLCHTIMYCVNNPPTKTYSTGAIYTNLNHHDKLHPFNENAALAVRCKCLLGSFNSQKNSTDVRNQKCMMKDKSLEAYSLQFYVCLALSAKLAPSFSRSPHLSNALLQIWQLIR